MNIPERRRSTRFDPSLPVGLLLVCAAALVACSDVAYLARARPDASVGADSGSFVGGPYCDRLSRLADLPTIDGRVEAGLGLEPIPRSQWRDGDPMPEAEISYAAAWHPQGVYLYVTVSDPTRAPRPAGGAPWCGDAVHLFVDGDGVFSSAPDYDDPGTRQFILVPPVEDGGQRREGSVWMPEEGRGPWSSDDYVAIATSTGYAVEAFVRGADLGVGELALGPDARVGFDISVSLSGMDVTGPEPPECFRVGDIALRYDDTVSPFRTAHTSTFAFCTPEIRD